ncbi:hypothetical protein NQ317_000611 [Molorchus minor]|uniref:Regulatory protein zeste n=1 Tax=Molorchus minor TaxID=1323400 RepID=A0ABQ9JT98_9CUCU|nr:hypothetical protein NQ317_000611 [Molorchus minor]
MEIEKHKDLKRIPISLMEKKVNIVNVSNAIQELKIKCQERLAKDIPLIIKNDCVLVENGHINEKWFHPAMSADQVSKVCCEQIMEKIKRTRCNNVTANEIEVLLTLVESHKGVVECKKTDVVTNGEKDFEKIAIKFNSAVGTGRTSKHLRNKWDAWKKRKNDTVIRKFLYLELESGVFLLPSDCTYKNKSLCKKSP